MTTTLITSLTRFFPTPAKAGKSVVARLVELQSIRNERRALAEMGAEQLDDIGIDATQAQAEASRPAWDAPERWLR